VPIRVDERHGESIADVDPSVAWLFGPVRTWSSTIEVYQRGPQEGLDGNQNVVVLYAHETLAANRAGEALALRIRLQLFRLQGDAHLHPQRSPEPIGQSGWLYVLPAHAPWRAEEVAAETLSAFLDRSAGAPTPAWLDAALLPATPEEDAELAELDEAERHIEERRPVVEARRGALRRVSGLLYETGAALERVVAEALSELGVALSEPIGNEEYLALHDRILSVVEVKGNSKSASGSDYRACMDHALMLTTSGTDARGILVVNAWRTSPPDERREWFPDNVVSTARAQRTVALVRSIDLYEAVLAQRRDDDVAAFVDALFATSGLVELPQPRSRAGSP
jgi:hypothetical protein